MVKPPKTMQPESADIDLSKAGRASGKSFQQDSFHQYMARKIDMQRHQFGLMLPPPPPAATSTSIVSTSTPPTTPTPATDNSPAGRRKSLLKPSSSSPSPLRNRSPGRAVRFVQLSPSHNNNNNNNKKKATSNSGASSGGSSGGSGSGTDMGSILHRLQERHGRGRQSRGLGLKRKRKEVSNASRNLFSQKDDEKAETRTSSSSQQMKMKMKMDDDDIKDQEMEETLATPQNEDGSNILDSFLCSGSAPTPSMRRARPDLFLLGVVVKVNGYTDPDNETLKRMLQKHGGDLETYETTRVTHIIAEHLSKAKADIYKQQRKPRPVCKPSWIVDSVRQGRVLPYGNYLLEELKDRTGQTGIQAMFGAARKTQESSSQKKPKRALFLPEKKEEKSPAVTESEESILGLPPLSNVVRDPITQEESKRSSLLSQPRETAMNETSEQLQEGNTGHLCEATEMEGGLQSEEGAVEIVGNDQDCQLDGTTMGRDLESDSTSQDKGSSKTTSKRLGRTDSKCINGKIRTTGTFCCIWQYTLGL
jgi:hypothetical protein